MVYASGDEDAPTVLTGRFHAFEQLVAACPPLLCRPSGHSTIPPLYLEWQLLSAAQVAAWRAVSLVPARSVERRVTVRALRGGAMRRISFT
jgi:hypothetical protein